MDLFGLKSHEEQHQNVERVLRRLVEQVGQLSIDLGQTRTDLRRLSLVVAGKVEAGDIDPTMVGANEALGLARQRLAELQASADEHWNALSVALDAAVAEARAQAAATLEEE